MALCAGLVFMPQSFGGPRAWARRNIFAMQFLCCVLTSLLLTLLVVIRTNVPAPPPRHAPAAATPGVARLCGGFCAMARATQA